MIFQLQFLKINIQNFDIRPEVTFLTGCRLLSFFLKEKGQGVNCKHIRTYKCTYKKKRMKEKAILNDEAKLVLVYIALSLISLEC